MTVFDQGTRRSDQTYVNNQPVYSKHRRLMKLPMMPNENVWLDSLDKKSRAAGERRW